MPPMPAATITPARRLRGRLRVPGDKSIAHRYALLAALAEGRSTLDPFCPRRRLPVDARLPARRSASTVDEGPDGTVTLLGRGFGQLRSPAGAARRRQFGHDDAAAGRRAGGPALLGHAGRRRVAVAPADAPRDRRRSSRWAPASKRPTGTRRSRFTARRCTPLRTGPRCRAPRSRARSSSPACTPRARPASTEPARPAITPSGRWRPSAGTPQVDGLTVSVDRRPAPARAGR